MPWNPSYWSAKEYFRFFGLKHTFYLPVHALKRGSAIGSRNKFKKMEISKMEKEELGNFFAA